MAVRRSDARACLTVRSTYTLCRSGTGSDRQFTRVIPMDGQREQSRPRARETEAPVRQPLGGVP